MVTTRSTRHRIGRWQPRLPTGGSSWRRLSLVSRALLWRIDDEAANTLTHAAGLALATVGAPLLVALALREATAWRLLGCIVFALALVLMFAVSTLYHAAKDLRRKAALRAVDHSCIYLLIAGTYTPVTLSTLPGAWAWIMLALVWGFALAGVGEVLINVDRAGAPLWPYLAMAGLFVVAARQYLAHVPPAGLAWLALGGLFYLLGLYFFKRDVRLSHAVWHLFVIAGSACHYTAVMGCVLTV